MVIHKRLNSLYSYRKILYRKRDRFKNKYENKEFKNRIKNIITLTNKEIKNTKEKLYVLFKNNKDKIRYLNKNILTKKRIISIFESTLTRTLGLQENELYEDLFIIQTYFFDVLEDIILNGFIHNGEKYVCFTASAGQIRTKKTVFIKESLLKKYQMSLYCGLTTDKINEKGGVNINKYLSYLALCNSATDEWKEFDIDRAIVVDDMETKVNGVVDFIDDVDYTIIRKQMDVPIEHTDGCGMYLPCVNRKNTMIRLPWIKGLLISFPFDEFIKEYNGNSKIKDIYGKEWDIFKDNIQVIFFKSQFKMWKYYDSWEQYKNYYKQYNCQAGVCNEEVDDFKNAKFSYQMLQTLSDMTDEELEDICKVTKHNIKNIGRDRGVMLRILGVTKANKNKNYIQQALEIYPELLNDTYSKEILKSVKKSLVKQAKAGRVDIEGVYTFIAPDLFAVCEYLFLGNKNPKGLLNDGEVFCNIYKNRRKLDCLRSPSLFREHPVRNNVVTEDKKRWFITNALYTSCHDLISKILQFDVDGDMSLVCAESTLIKVAERNMENIVPLFYNMRNAGVETVTDNSIHGGLIRAYSGGNIGIISNDITKIWNSDNINLDAIKLLCMETNFTIDYAKTLYKPIRSKEITDLISKHTKYKTPHFFIYAKGKTKKQVEKINNSVVNRLSKIIPNPRIDFVHTKLEKFNYEMLMRNTDIVLDMDIIDKYTELDLKGRYMLNKEDGEKYNNTAYVYQDIKKRILEINSNVYYVTDVLVEFLYKYKEENIKTTLWECFGDIMVENLKNNLKDGFMLCEICGKRIKKTSNRRKYCGECAKRKQLEWQKLSMKKARNVKS